MLKGLGATVRHVDERLHAGTRRVRQQSLGGCSRTRSCRAWARPWIAAASPASVTQFQLLAWCSPAYPTGAFSYSHGMEWAVERGTVYDTGGAAGFHRRSPGTWRRLGGRRPVRARLARGTSTTPDLGAQRAGALRELAEARRGIPRDLRDRLGKLPAGRAFLEVTLKAWPHPRLAEFAADLRGRRIAQSVAVAVACAAHDIELPTAIQAFVQVLAANLVSAGARLIPLGQTDAQIAVARLAAVVAATAQRAMAADPDDLGTLGAGAGAVLDAS